MAMTNRGHSAVNHPSHYTQGNCETIYEIRDILGPVGFKAYCLGNWIKYNARAAYKNGEEDLKKADVYLEWAVKGLPPLNARLTVRANQLEAKVHPSAIDKSVPQTESTCDGNHGEPPCSDPECWLK